MSPAGLTTREVGTEPGGVHAPGEPPPDIGLHAGQDRAAQVAEVGCAGDRSGRFRTILNEAVVPIHAARLCEAHGLTETATGQGELELEDVGQRTE